VSAASVIAKVIRDTEVEKLSRIYGDIGSGYPSDPKTIGFLKKVLKSGVIPPFVRRSWRTVDNILRDLRIRE
ncbi:MAG: ribonuclease HII, partial [Thermoprotei archaeon]